MFSRVQLYLFRVYQTGQESSYVEDESGMDGSEDGSGEDGSSFGAGMPSLFLTSLELLYFSHMNVLPRRTVNTNDETDN